MAHESEKIEPLFEAAALRGSVAELAKQLTADLGEGPDEGDSEPLLLAILGGSLIFLADLVRAIDRPVRFELMQVAMSAEAAAGAAGAGAEPEGGEAPGAQDRVVNLHYPIPVEIAGRRVVVLKDVV